jgi:hypothetical protein
MPRRRTFDLRCSLRAACAVACGLVAACAAGAQDVEGVENRGGWYGPLAQAPAAEPKLPAVAPLAPAWHENLRVRNAAIVGAGVVVAAIYGKNKWWHNDYSGGFKVENEGFFGKDTRYGGADKLGHMFMNYANVRLFTPLFELAGNSRSDSIWYSALSSVAIFTAIEIADGFSTSYRFSPQDEVMNIAGAALGVIMETHPGLDEKFDFRFKYNKSGSDFNPSRDYSGHRYLIVAKADGFDSLRHVPVLRYLELSLGYQASGYQQPGAERRRDIYVGLGLNLSRLLADGVYGGQLHTTRPQRVAELAFELYQFPTALYTSFRLD